MTKIYKIHPSIGFARLGNADLTKTLFDDILKKWRNPDYKIGGKVIPFPARFQIWEHTLNAAGDIIESIPVSDNTLNVEKIEWRVCLANKKAAFYKFWYREGDKIPNRNGFRNRYPQQWVMNPGAVTISGKNIFDKKIIYTKTRSNQRIPTLQLGSLCTNKDGHLYVFGGKGISKSAGRPPVKLVSDPYNTPTWYDDVADGPVTVYLKFKDQTKPTPVDPSWVIVGPPDFAPPLENIVTLYDVLVDLLVRNVIKLTSDNQKLLKQYLHLEEIYNDFKANGFTKLSSYKPHFHDDILPILKRGHILKYVSAHSGGGHGVTMKTPDFDKLTDQQRKDVFIKMRVPPTGTGGNMPKMHGDSYNNDKEPDRYLFITKTQHELLRRWSDGDFIKSTSAGYMNPPFWTDAIALNKTVGGALAPGIEVSWMFRNPKIYSSPFRIDHAAREEYNAPGFKGGTIAAGHFTRQLANPWQADFTSCAITEDMVAWWPAQRPDDVFTSSDFTKPMVPWFRDSAGTALTQYQEMIDKWHEMGFVIRDSSGGYVEKR